MTVAVVGSRDVAKEFGKKGTSSDVTLFNHVRDGHALTVVEPTQYPEKLAPLLCAVQMADRALFVVPQLSREVAETATLLDLARLPVQLARGGSVGEEELRRAFRGMRFVDQPSSPFDPVRLRQELEGWSVAPVPGPTRVPLDHAFPVRGVGAVALGVVRGGPIQAHAKLRLYPTEREVEVRSIQVHDVDVPSAATGERVGVALKGIEAEELSRGQVLAPGGTLSTGSRLIGEGLRRCPYYKGPLAVGSQLHLSVGLQLPPVRLEEVAEGTLTLLADRPVVFAGGETAFLVDLSATQGPRVAARVELRAP